LSGDVPRQKLFAELDKLKVMSAVKVVSLRSERNLGLTDFCREQLCTL